MGGVFSGCLARPIAPSKRTMSERIVAKRFALKFSPRPTIALEYQRAATDPPGVMPIQNVLPLHRYYWYEISLFH